MGGGGVGIHPPPSILDKNSPFGIGLKNVDKKMFLPDKNAHVLQLGIC